MKLRIVVIALLAATLAAAQVTVNGYLDAGPNSVAVESTYFEYSSSQVWFQTPGWSANPGEIDTFEFPPFPGFPAIIRLAADFGGLPILLELNRPTPSTWYQFPVPFELTKVMFDYVTGLEAPDRTRPGWGFTVVPSLVRANAVVHSALPGQVTVVNGTGQTVRTFRLETQAVWAADDDAGRPLPEGIYFCRLMTRTGSALRKVLIAR